MGVAGKKTNFSRSFQLIDVSRPFIWGHLNQQAQDAGLFRVVAAKIGST
jgi:hypothetical protein